MFPPPFHGATLAQMQLAAAAVEVQARAHAHVQAAQAAQLMQYLQMHGQPAGQQAMEEMLHQPFWQPGMMLRLAASEHLPAPPGMPAPAVSPSTQHPAAGKAAHARARSSTESAASWTAGSKQGSTAPSAASEDGSSAAAPSGGAQKKCKENLRSYLQEVRSEDPRCIFITRRINKLGFRSKSVLERHFAQYGEVTKIMVAHSKVKPYPNSGCLPRTRPGNFGLVVMRSPDAVAKILQQGPEQLVADVAIQVYRFEGKELEGEEGFDVMPEQTEGVKEEGESHKQHAESPSHALAQQGPPGLAIHAADWSEVLLDQGSPAQGEAEPAMEVAPPHEVNEGEELATASNSSHGSSGEAISELPDSNGQSGYSGSSNGSAKANKQTTTSASTMSLTDSHLTDLGRGMYCGESRSTSVGSHDKASNSSFHGNRSYGFNGSDGNGSNVSNGSNGNGSNYFDDHSSQDSAKGGTSEAGGLQAAMLDDQLWPGSNLAGMLNELGHIARDSQQIRAFTKEQSFQAAALAHMVQQRLVRLELECQQKIADIKRAGMAAEAAATSEEYEVIMDVQDAAAAAKAAASTTDQSTSQVSKASRSDAAADGRSSSSSSGNHRGRQRQDNGAVGAQRDTLRSYLTELLTEDPDCIFITRRINKLGFRSREILKGHFSLYGEVLRVLVAHSKVKPFRDSSGQMRTRPGGLGLVVMRSADDVRSILALGEEQEVAGHQIRVQSFERPKVDTTSYKGSGGSGTSTNAGSHSNGTLSNGSGGSGSNGSGGSGRTETSGSDEGSEEARNADGSGSRGDKSEEGGSSDADAYQKSDEGDGASSAPESPEGSPSES